MKRTFKVRILYDAYREYTVEAETVGAAEDRALEMETNAYVDECDPHGLKNAGFRCVEITEVRKK